MTRVLALLKKTEANGCTEEEAGTAFAAAQRLLAEHNLDMAEVLAADTAANRQHEETYDFESGTLPFIHDLPDDYIRAGSIVMAFYGCVVMLRTDEGKKRLLLFGPRVNVETGRYVLRFLVAAFDRLWHEYVKAHPWTRPGDRVTFVQGVCTGFRAKMEEEKAKMEVEARKAGRPGMEIALRNMNEIINAKLAAKYGQINHGGVQPKGSGSGRDDVRMAGETAGRNLNIAKPLPDPGSSGPKGIGHG